MTAALPGAVDGVLVAGLLDAIWPPCCAACRAPAWGGGDLCAVCATRLPSPRPRCPRCGRVPGLEAPRDPCARCRDEDLALDGVVVGLGYHGAARDLVRSLKYRRCPAAARPLAHALVVALRQASIPGDLVVPVPLGMARLRRRGYDQSCLLARHVAAALGLDRAPAALRRRRETPPQTGRGRKARHRNVRGAFRARRRPVAGRCVLLVDDVLTTGATARAAALALRRAGASAVVAAVACRAG